jgi:hypothetical protein
LVSKNQPYVVEGDRYGRWLVLETASVGSTRVECLCDCGTRRTVVPYQLRAGKSKSCGCLNEEAKAAYYASGRWAGTANPKYRHGLAKSHPELYHAWHNMIQRCCNPNNPYYHAYGGRGITACERWLGNPEGLANFVADMAPTWAKGLQLDRIDGELGYSPENCQWLTQAENARKVRPKIRNADYEALVAENARLAAENRRLRERIDKRAAENDLR